MLVPRSQLSVVETERDEWRRRAEALRSRGRTKTEYVFLRSPLWARFVAASWLVLLGLLVGGVAVPRANDRPTLHEDYQACIATAREAYRLETNQYRELVKALYACGVYERP
jgi:hypothetical protein